jgi:hypothetical protein
MRALAASIVFLAALTAAPAQAHDTRLTHRDTRDELSHVSVAATAAAAAAPDALPTAWCGDPRTADDTANAALAPSSPRFKLVYAHPADRPDRFAQWQDALQANVAVVQRFLASQSGGAKGVRIDMGTRCGPQYADLQVVHLPGPRVHYVDNFAAVVNDVEPRLGRADGPRNVVVFGDTLNGGGYDYGLGENVLGPAGERPGADNVHNAGGFASVLFTRDGVPAPGAGAPGWWPEGMLHEMTHNLGAVQWSAPHTTQPAGFTDPGYGHCWQGYDVMCYVEGPGAAHPMRYDCPRTAGAIPQVYDCGRDDYFNPAPAPGSYLARSWNVYNSAFLAPCEQIAPACGGGLEAAVPAPPVSTAAPRVSGRPLRGSRLVAKAGGWRNGPLSFSYRWQRYQRGAWRTIAGAQRVRYAPKRADRGRRLRVQVIASNPDGRASAASAPTARVVEVSCPARARRPAARCLGRRSATRAQAPGRAARPRTSAAARAG